MENQEMLYKIQMLQQQAGELNKQLEAISKAINDLSSIKESLENLENKKGEEVLANIGRGIFIKTKLEDDEVYVNVGNKNIVKKSIPDAVELINEQIKELLDMKQKLDNQLDDLRNEAGNLTG